MSRRVLVVLGLWLSLILPELSAQQSTKPNSLTVPLLKKRMKALEGDKELPPTVKDGLVTYLEKAVERLEIAQEQIDYAEGFERRLSQVGDALKTAERRLSQLPAAPDPMLAMDADIDELDRLVDATGKLIDDAETGLRKQIADLDQESKLRRTRPEELINALTEVEDRLRDIDAEMEEGAASNEPRELIQAHQLFLQARRQRAECERRAIQAETAWLQNDAAADLLQVQQELAAKTLNLKVAELEILQKELGKQRGDEADQRVRQFEAVVSKVNDDLKPIAQKNLDLATEQRDITHKLHDVDVRNDNVGTTIADLTRQFEHTQQMVDHVGPTDSIGLLLRQQRTRLLDPRLIRSNLSRRSDTVRETRMRMYQLEADRNELIDLDAVTSKQAEQIAGERSPSSLLAGLKPLLVDQRQLLKGLEAEYQQYFNKLFEIDVAERRLLQLTTQYSDYVDERVLWIRTGQPFGSEQLSITTASLPWIADANLWQSVLEAGWIDAFRRPMSWAAACVAFVLWFGLRPILKGFIRRKGVVTGDPNCRDMGPTLQTIVATLLIASGFPAALWFVGWRLDHIPGAEPFAHAVASGLLRMAVFIFPFCVLRMVCLRGGLGQRHFDWSLSLVDRWRRHLGWYLPVGMVLVGIIGAVEGSADEHRLDSLGRAAYLLFAMLSIGFNRLTLRNSANIVDAENVANQSELDLWANRFWRMMPRILFVVSLGLFVMGWAGYFYTALQLTWRLQRMVWLGMGLLIVRSTISRWISLERRRMAELQAAELHSITAAGREPGSYGQSTFLFPRWHWPDFRLNLTQIVTQMRSLFDTALLTLAAIGMWYIWADVTPALNIFDRVTLWQTTVERTVPIDLEGTDGNNGMKVVKQQQPVTAADLGLGILVVGIAVIAGRNIPGLVEVILLEHLSVDAGIRFAVTCLVRYAIFITGVCLAFAQISIGWSNVQWLVAAASVGLGFGLQEIFANFVSGIIILFERPMRVGDVITISDTTGTVSRIRFRATTIVDGDRKELIVPNKEFITGRLLNWTLSDRVNRVGIKIVVSGTCDPQKVRRLLLEIAAQHPQLLKDPAPSATLEDLNGGLTFYLRAFLPTLEGRAVAIHELHNLIHDRFQAEGIDMPCPSQEVFVRMDRAGTAAPPVPHQPTTAVPIMPLQPDFGSAFRRA